jgi:hypothetical protein
MIHPDDLAVIEKERLEPSQLTEASAVRFDQEHADWLVFEAVAMRNSWHRPTPWGQILRELKCTEKALRRLLDLAKADRPGSGFLQSTVIHESDTARFERMLQEAHENIESVEYHAKEEGPGRPRDEYMDTFVWNCNLAWRKFGGEGTGSYKSAHASGGYDGPVLRLILFLLDHVGFEHTPSPAAIHSTIQMCEQERRAEIQKS